MQYSIAIVAFLGLATAMPTEVDSGHEDKVFVLAARNIELDSALLEARNHTPGFCGRSLEDTQLEARKKKHCSRSADLFDLGERGDDEDEVFALAARNVELDSTLLEARNHTPGFCGRSLEDAQLEARKKKHCSRSVQLFNVDAAEYLS